MGEGTTTLSITEMKAVALAAETRLAVELTNLRKERDELNARIKVLVAELDEASRISRLLNRQPRSKD